LGEKVAVVAGLSQDLLDELAGAWSRLDRARPVAVEDTPQLLQALADWIRLAVRVEDELQTTLGLPYLASRAAVPGGAALPGLRHVHGLMANDGRAVVELVTVSAGSPPTYHDATWRPFDQLPEPLGGPPALSEESAYRLHLEGTAARVLAADMTRFLLDTALDHDDHVAEAIEPAG
jgi:hypothetical protein